MIMQKIANPIYDVVFKYLLENNKIAKLLISDLIGLEIEKLELRPQEFSTNAENRTLTVYRIDFKAEVMLPNKEKLVVLIEIQKAKFTTDLIRFRRYLSEQYASQQNTIKREDGNMVPLPIITIYFLGYGLENNRDIPIIRVKRQYLDNYNGDQLQGKELFIETLTHDSIIVQIPALKKNRRNDLEKALSIFEAGKVQEVSINEADYPERYKPVIRRLLKAIANESIRKNMDVEDEILEHLQAKERFIEAQKKALEEKDKSLKEKNKSLKAKDESLKKKDESIRKKDTEFAEMIKRMKASGMSDEQIAEITNKTAEDIRKIQK